MLCYGIWMVLLLGGVETSRLADVGDVVAALIDLADDCSNALLPLL